MFRHSSSLFTVIAAAAFLFGVANPANAQVSFAWVTVTNAGNAADPQNEESVPGIGSVPYHFRIAKYEVTNDQYTEFLNAVAKTDLNGLYNASMGSDPRRDHAGRFLR